MEPVKFMLQGKNLEHLRRWCEKTALINCGLTAQRTFHIIREKGAIPISEHNFYKFFGESKKTVVME